MNQFRQRCKRLSTFHCETLFIMSYLHVHHFISAPASTPCRHAQKKHFTSHNDYYVIFNQVSIQFSWNHFNFSLILVLLTGFLLTLTGLKDDENNATSCKMNGKCRQTSRTANNHPWLICSCVPGSCHQNLSLTAVSLQSLDPAH